jgi:hypothetical protein
MKTFHINCCNPSLCYHIASITIETFIPLQGNRLYSLLAEECVSCYYPSWLNFLNIAFFFKSVVAKILLQGCKHMEFGPREVWPECGKLQHVSVTSGRSCKLIIWPNFLCVRANVRECNFETFFGFLKKVILFQNYLSCCLCYLLTKIKANNKTKPFEHTNIFLYFKASVQNKFCVRQFNIHFQKQVFSS